MTNLTAKNTAGSRQTEPNTTDQLIDFRKVGELLGLRCKTGHTARAFAARGQIRAVRVNSRVVRYSLRSVLALVAGYVPAECATPGPVGQKEAA